MVATTVIKTDINPTCRGLFIIVKQFIYDKLTAKFGRNRKGIQKLFMSGIQVCVVSDILHWLTLSDTKQVAMCFQMPA